MHSLPSSTSFFPFTGNPNAGANRYKIQVRYVSGEYSLLSPYHNTMFISNNSGTFTWNHYAVENDAVPLPSVSAYILYRDDNATGDCLSQSRA